MATNLKHSAKKLASKGRRGDKFLLHVNRPEMMALMATGGITRNPKTGLPEAFNLLKSIQGLNEKINPFAGSSNFLAQLADPFSDASRDLNLGAGPILNFNEAKKMSFSNPFSAEASGWDVLAGGTAAEDPEMRRLGRTVGTMFAAGALGNWAGAGAEGAGAGAVEGGTAAGTEGTALYSTPASTGPAGLYGGAVSTPATTTLAGPGGTALGGSTIPTASLSAGAGSAGMGSSGFDEAGFSDSNFSGGEVSPFDEAGFTLDSMPGDIPLDTSADFGLGSPGFENNLSAELSAGAPADPSYYQQLLDWLKQRGWKANLRTGMGLYNSLDGYMQAKAMEKLAKRADPMAAYRPGYAADLAALSADPSRLNRTPGYQAGEQAVMRRMASQGYIGSGNMMRALQDYGTNAYDKEISRLSGLVNSPGAMQAAQMQEAASQQRSRALASLGFTAAGMF